MDLQIRLIHTVSYFLLIFFFLVAGGIFKVNAQVVINEISPESSPDWVEIYAVEDTDISGWKLDDNGTATFMYVFPSGTLIGPGHNSFITVDVGTRLNKNGDVIYLYKKDGILVDSVSYGGEDNVCIPESAGSVGRYPDANSTIERFRSSSKGLTNNTSEIFTCPSPTMPPLPSPIPTVRPTTTPLPSATTNPKPTAIATRQPTTGVLSQNDSIENTDGKSKNIEDTVLGVKNQLDESPVTTVSGKKSKNGVTSILLITGGGCLLGISGLSLIIKNKKRYNLGRKKHE